MISRKAIAITLVLLFALCGCAGEQTKPATTEMLVTSCDSIALQFTDALKQELMAAMK